MAIFWNHIKGTGNASSNSNGLWTWIKWSKKTEPIPNNGPYSEDYSGEILVSNSNGSPDDAKPLGKILTTNINATTYGHWTTYGNWISDASEDSPAGAVWEWKYANNTKFKIQAWDEGPVFGVAGYALCVHTLRSDDSSILRLIDQADNTKHDIVAWSLEKIQVDHPLYNTKIIHTDDKCEASYFNATSDKRAKENITPATFSGLNLINKLPVYTFNYKDKTDVVPGILAQDLLEAQPEELNLVDNIAATGENGDYMSIKADKLIFVLMQAIKEQQAQIDELKAELKKLTK